MKLKYRLAPGSTFDGEYFIFEAHNKNYGMVKDRDLNAAENINMVGRAHPEPTDACGHDGPVSRPYLTEATSMAKAGSEDVQ